MKSFLEEYGFVILAAIVVILIIAMCTPVGNLIKRQVMNVADSFAGKSKSKLSAVDAGEDSVQIKQSAIGEIEVTVTSNSTTDKFDVQYRVKADKSTWENWTILGDGDLINNESKQHTEKFSITVQDGYSIQVRVKNIGKNDNYYMESNVIRYKANFIASEGSEGTSNSAPGLDDAIASLNDGEIIEVYNANGGKFPGGETEIWVKFRLEDYTLIESYPEFSNIDEFDNYMQNASKHGYLFNGTIYDTNGLSEDEFWEKYDNGEYDVVYGSVVWKQINKDSNGIPIPDEGERVEVYYGDGGVLPNGDENWWVYFMPSGSITSSDEDVNNFSRDGYIPYSKNETSIEFTKDTKGLSKEEFNTKVNNGEIKVVEYHPRWTTEAECVAEGNNVYNGYCVPTVSLTEG